MATRSCDVLLSGQGREIVGSQRRVFGVLIAMALVMAACIKFEAPVGHQASAVQWHRVQLLDAADVTGNGLDEAVVLTNQDELVLYSSCGGGCLSELQRIAVDANGFVLADVNSDGRTDIAMNIAGSNTWWPGTATGFDAASSTPIVSSGAPVMAGDFTGDGVLDLVTTLVVPPALYVIAQILEGDGAGGFTPGQFLLSLPQTVFLDPANPLAINFGSADIDGDGDLEFLVSSGTGTVIIQSDGTSTTLAGWALASGDIDGDGRDDLAVDRDGTVVFVQSTVAGWVDFLNGQGFAAAPFQVGKLWDFEGDGIVDFAYGDLWASGAGNGRFPTVAESFPAGLDRGTALGDVDGDGLDDVLIDSDGMFAEFQLHRNISTLPEE